MLEVMDEIYKEVIFQELFPLSVIIFMANAAIKGFSLLSGLRDLVN
jgi:hypothetical protein